MTRSFSKLFLFIALVAVSAGMIGSPCQSLTLVSPTPDQKVRENVKITIPVSALPSGFFGSGDSRPFIGVLVGDQPGSEEFVEAVSASAVVRKGDDIVFYWDSKAKYRDPKDSSGLSQKTFKDGVHSLKVEIYQQTQRSATVVGSGSVNIVLKNKVDRTNPAPAVTLANSLPFGVTNAYRIRTGLQLFDVVNLPILSSVGLTGDFCVIQTVEDVRSNGQIMVRMRLDDKANMSIFGNRTWPYMGQTMLPQLYRLINKYGAVFNRNMFKKQAQYTITDVLPVLPTKPVKEGDSWPDTMYLKVEGITAPLRLSGTCRLDSFEWHKDKECAKLVSDMAVDGQISFNGDTIRSNGRISATVTTFFSYKTGKMITRIIDFEFPVAIAQGAGTPNSGGGAVAEARPSGPTTPFDDNESDASYGRPTGNTGASQANAASSTPTQKGKAVMTVTIQLEK